MTLDAMKPGQECEILDITAEGIVGQRLMDMGFIPGARVKMVRNAPLVDPVEFLMKGCHISLRHSEAKKVEVKPL
ncbi:MAG: iron transporter FeoA [Desulfobacteraceae bacterium 4484_190.1]|nr:ferrous iron transport protein A [Deltaproteobacteria bacterium]OPX34830.1 MAG: iron transporter FeoA [Desulfobacteraceae bacterium 4484_190.1]